MGCNYSASGMQHIQARWFTRPDLRLLNLISEWACSLQCCLYTLRHLPSCLGEADSVCASWPSVPSNTPLHVTKPCRTTAGGF